MKVIQYEQNKSIQHDIFFLHLTIKMKSSESFSFIVLKYTSTYAANACMSFSVF